MRSYTALKRVFNKREKGKRGRKKRRRETERDVKEMFSFPHLMIIAKPVLPPSEIDWLAASDHGDKQC